MLEYLAVVLAVVFAGLLAVVLLRTQIKKLFLPAAPSTDAAAPGGVPLPPVPEPPPDPLAAHRHVIALENRARQEACRLAADLGLPLKSGAPAPGAAGRPGVWVLAGAGPLGGVALALARHLVSLGADVGVQVLAHEGRQGADVQREARSVRAADLELVESPRVQPMAHAVCLVAGVDETLLSDARRQECAAIHKAALRRGFRIERLEPFDPAFRPPAPRLEDVVIPVPPEPLAQEEVRLLDSLAQQNYGLRGAALMENAGYWAAREAFLFVQQSARARGRVLPTVAVVCGRGNNGGDGFVVARHLLHWGIAVEAVLVGEKEKVTDDAARNLALLEDDGVKVRAIFDPSQWPLLDRTLTGRTLIVDALLGTGMSGAVRGPALEALRRINAAHAAGIRVLSLDCPSGLDCNTGAPLGECVQADVTVTFAAPKIGFSRGSGPQLCGRVVLADIGLPRALYGRRETARREK